MIAEAAQHPFWPSPKRNPPEFTAFERSGTCVLACSLLDFVRVLVSIWSDFTIYRSNPNVKSVGPCKHLKPLRTKKVPRTPQHQAYYWQQTLIQQQRLFIEVITHNIVHYIIPYSWKSLRLFLHKVDKLDNEIFGHLQIIPYRPTLAW